MDTRFPDVGQIAVLRGGGLGDLLVALPAIEALAAAYPAARLVLLGTPAHAELLADRPSPVSHVEVLPVAPGIRDPSTPANQAQAQAQDPAQAQAQDSAGAGVRAFHARVAALGPIDLGVQLHGGGRYSNPFLMALGPRHTVGLATPDAPRLERTLPYIYYQHEVMRWLEAAALAGAAPHSLEPRIVVTDRERASIVPRLPDGRRPLAVLHPGASDPRRRWPAERFAGVAVGLLDDGGAVRVIGDARESALADDVVDRVRRLRRSPSDLASFAGDLTLGETTALLAAAEVVVANDSGPRHLAQAVGTATVGVFWFGNVVNAAPFSRARHRVHLSFVVRCPVCGIDVTQVGWTAARCRHDVSFVAEVAVAPVLADARQLMARRAPRRGR